MGELTSDGIAFKKALIDNGIKLYEFSDRAGLSTSFVSGWAHGRRQCSPRLAAALTKILGWSNFWPEELRHRLNHAEDELNEQFKTALEALPTHQQGE